MARPICPSCGAAYNGKKCRNCLYEHFMEEIAHGNHTHKGEPLVIDAPVRRRIPRKDPFGCERKSHRKNPMVRFLLLLTVIYSLMPMLRNWGLKLEAMENRPAAVMQTKPEPLMAPEEMTVLHEEQGVKIFAGMEDLEDFRDGLCVYVQYSGALSHVTISAGDLRVNGCDMKFSSLVCKARRGGEIWKGWLELDERDLEANSIETLETLSFTMTALGSNGRAMFTTDEIRIVAEDGV